MTPQAKRAIATAATKALREMDKISFVCAGSPVYDRLRREILNTIDDCGYTVIGDPWRAVLKTRTDESQHIKNTRR